MEDIADEHFGLWCQYRRSFNAYASMKFLPRAWKTQVHVYWGRTHTGKTRFVTEQSEGRSVFRPYDYEWFCGYTNQDIVILDDYRGQYPIDFFLRLCDRYPMSVRVKGGSANWAPKKIYITSNISICSWYPNADRPSIDAMYRRLTMVAHVKDVIYEDMQ